MGMSGSTSSTRFFVFLNASFFFWLSARHYVHLMKYFKYRDSASVLIFFFFLFWQSERHYGHLDEYLKYRGSTSVLVPLPSQAWVRASFFKKKIFCEQKIFVVPLSLFLSLGKREWVVYSLFLHIRTHTRTHIRTHMKTHSGFLPLPPFLPYPASYFFF